MSTTEDTSKQPHSAPGDTTTKTIDYMETTEAYNKWAEVYDTDGNFLQALDSLEMETLLPALLQKVPGPSDATPPSQKKLVDLGCGTGRTTMRLLDLTAEDTLVVGLDASPGMLEVARGRIAKEAADRVSLGIFDLLASPAVVPGEAVQADGIVSTLVLEHIPLERFFEAAAEMLVAGGVLAITNMHSDMGAISGAGFVDTVTGRKIRPTSYSHTIEEVVEAAGKAGFRVEEVGGEKVRERMVDERLAGVLGTRARKWVGIVVWFGICFRKMV